MMRWMIPTCRKMGRMNRHHSVYIHVSFSFWGDGGGRGKRGRTYGQGFHRGNRHVHRFVQSYSPLLASYPRGCYDESHSRKKKVTRYTYLDVSFKQASSKVAGKAETFFIQGGKRAPILMRTSDDGPIWTLMVLSVDYEHMADGLIQVKTDVPCS